jgi:hypothetical protein
MAARAGPEDDTDEEIRLCRAAIVHLTEYAE